MFNELSCSIRIFLADTSFSKLFCCVLTLVSLQQLGLFRFILEDTFSFLVKLLFVSTSFEEEGSMVLSGVFGVLLFWILDLPTCDFFSRTQVSNGFCTLSTQKHFSFSTGSL